MLEYCTDSKNNNLSIYVLNHDSHYSFAHFRASGAKNVRGSTTWIAEAEERYRFAILRDVHWQSSESRDVR